MRLSILGVLLPALVLAACATDRQTPTEASENGRRAPSAVASLTAPVDGSDAGYARADEVVELSFPMDHGPHPDFQTEWWYLTANLETTDGRRYGLQWTIFRRALRPSQPFRDSSWATRQVYLGHFAITDVERGRQHSFERLARGAVGLAGSELEAGGPLRVWLEDWSLTSSEKGTASFPWTLRANGLGDSGGEPTISAEIDVRPSKPLVLQGDRGLSRKNSMAGGASYYYSFTRLAARGVLRIGDRHESVTGTAWLDREWSTSVLAPDQTGWDWFSLQLDDGRDLMVYRLRLEGGGIDQASSGALVGPSGEKTPLAVDDFTLGVLERWTSPKGTTYPIAWRLQLPKQGLDLEIRAVVADQELDVAFRYWEGAVDVTGIGSESGRGYVELVGYGD